MAKSQEAAEVAARHTTRPELRAMGRIDAILAGLSENEVAPVPAWALATYQGGAWKMSLAGERVAEGPAMANEGKNAPPT